MFQTWKDNKLNNFGGDNKTIKKLFKKAQCLKHLLASAQENFC